MKSNSKQGVDHELAIEAANKYGSTFKNPPEALHFGFLLGYGAGKESLSAEKERLRNMLKYLSQFKSSGSPFEDSYELERLGKLARNVLTSESDS